MTIIWQIAAHEWTTLWRSAAIGTLTCIVTILGTVTAITEWQEWKREQTIREQIQAREITQWLNLGEMHFHKAAHMGYFLVRGLPPGVILDRGAWDYAGTVIWLETHKRNATTLRPIDDRALVARGMPRGVGPVLLWLTPVLMVVLMHGTIARERISGSLAFMLGSGVSSGAIITGKTIANSGAAILAAAVPLLLGGALSYSGGAPPGSILAWWVSIILVLAVFAALITGISALARSPQGALVLLLSLWFTFVLVVPQLSVNAVDVVAPIPSSQVIRSNAEATTYDLDNEPTLGRLKAEYNAQGITNLNESGLYNLASEIDGSVALAELFAPLEKGMARQSTLLDILSWLSPIFAADRFGYSLSASADKDAFTFEQRAERQRIETQMVINRAFAVSPKNSHGNPSLWKKVINVASAAAKDIPDPGWNLAWPGLFIWAIIAMVLLTIASNMIKRGA